MPRRGRPTTTTRANLHLETSASYQTHSSINGGWQSKTGICGLRGQPWSTLLPAHVHLAEWIVCTLTGAIAIYFQSVLFWHAGAFWRDEANTIHIAKRPNIVELWRWQAEDSSPALFPVILREWITSGAGQSDGGLRAFGTLVAISSVVAVAVAGLVMSGRSPVVAVTLVALNPTVFYYGSSLRSHGLAAALIVACCAAFWTVARHGTRVRAAIALVLAILAAHASYHNSYLVLTAGLAGAIACASARLWKRAVVILGIGAVAGVSMLIYIPPILAYRDVTKIVRIPVSVKSCSRAYLRRAAARDGTRRDLADLVRGRGPGSARTIAS